MASWIRVRVSNLQGAVSLFGVALAAMVILLSVAAPIITGQDPLAQSAADRLRGPEAAHLLGRDAFGRDVLARLLYAGRVSLVVGLAAVALGGGLGTALGISAGYAGRWVEAVCMRAVDVMMSFPSLLTGLLVLAVLGPGLDKLILSIGVVIVPPFARVVHASTLSLKQREFVAAARGLGASHVHIVLRHLLPNVAGEALVLAGVSIATAIRIEAGLSFIGLGVSPPTPTWGNMLRDGVGELLRAPWLTLAPAAAVLVSVLAFNLVGDGLHDTAPSPAGRGSG